MKYPKIETVFNRDEKFKVKEDEVRLPEFANIKRWHVTEKIHGTNTRIEVANDILNITPRFRGRTEASQMPMVLIEKLQEMFPAETLLEAFPYLAEEKHVLVRLYGEGYGTGIQRGGNYRPDVSFRLCDVWVSDEENPFGGWWLEPESILDVAFNLNINPVPWLGIMTLDEAVEYIKERPKSVVSNEEGGNKNYLMEGIVARSIPLMHRRNGDRVMWKLKIKDFPKVKE